MKKPFLLLMLSLSFVACGQLKETKKTSPKTSGAVVTGAGLTTLQCSSMTSHGDPQDLMALSGFSVCSTSDPTIVKVSYNTAYSGDYYCAFTGTSGSVPVQSNPPCFAGGVGERFLQFSGSFNSLYIVLDEDAGAFGARIALPSYTAAQFR